MQKVKHTYEKRGTDTLVYRDGKPILMAMTNPNPEDKQHQNIIVLQKVKTINPDEIMMAIMEALMGDK